MFGRSGSRLALVAMLLVGACEAEGGQAFGPLSRDPCRCRMARGEHVYVVPCGTQLCAGEEALLCALEEEVEALQARCDPADHDTPFLGRCTGPPGCRDHLGARECSRAAGCEWAQAPCVLDGGQCPVELLPAHRPDP